MDTKVEPKPPDQGRSGRTNPLWKRYVYILLIAAWMGGFTFYALIVIPTAEKVLDSMRDTGFITQQITRWLNLIGAGVLLILAWMSAADWRRQHSRLRFGVASMWIIMAVAQAGLFIIHPLIDHLLEAEGHKLHHYEQFSEMHTIYLVFATVQWAAALLQIWLMLMIWRRQDREELGFAN